MKWVAIGKIVRAIGLRGHVGVSGSNGSLGILKRAMLRRGGRVEPEPRQLREARQQGRLWAVAFEGVATREAAEVLVGSEVLAAREDLGEPGEGAYYWADLDGLPVVTVAGEVIGVVANLLETGGVDVLVVKGGRGEVLLPLAPYVTVDREGHRVVVDPPEGLLELGESEGDGEGGPERGS